jgi:hypothetical protein
VRSRVALLLALAALSISAFSQATVSAPTEPGQATAARTAAPAASGQATPAPSVPSTPAAPALVQAALRTPSGRPAPARRRAPRRRRSIFPVVRVRGAVALRARPRGRVAARLSKVTEFGSPRVLGVAARRGRWLGVVTTALPNNRLAWVRRDNRGLRTARVGYSLRADLSARRLVLRRDGRVIRRFPVAIGRPGSPTPTGRFAVTDKLTGPRFGSYYGCCILALSGHQPNVPPGWRGGDRLAIHGTNAPGTIGQAASAGCLRAGDADLAVLMRRVRLGTPVFIHR